MINALLERREREQRRASLRAGMIAATICNANPFRKEGSEILTAEDFAPDPKAPQEPSEEEKLEQFREFFDSIKRDRLEAEAKKLRNG
jgi:hypothetical protein